MTNVPKKVATRKAVSPKPAEKVLVLRTCDENLRSYDFLGGPDPYKLRWTGDVRPRIAMWGYRGATRGGYLYRARLRPLMRDAIGPMMRRPPKRSGEAPSSR